MSRVEIIVGQGWSEDVRYIDSLRTQRPAETSLDLLDLRDIIDIVVDGNNLTAAIPEEAIFGLVVDLARAVTRLLLGESTKGIVEFHREPWELVLVPRGAQLGVSLYSVDRRREVIARDLLVEPQAFVEALISVGEEMLTVLLRVADHFSAHSQVREMSQILAGLKKVRRHKLKAAAGSASASADRVASTSLASGLTLGYRYDGADLGLRSYQGEHVFDLHALLFGGELCGEVDGQEVLLSGGYPFLSMKSLQDRCRQLFNQLEGHANEQFQLIGEMPHLGLEVYGEGSRWRLRLRDEVSGEWHDVWVTPSQCLDTMVTLGEVFLQELLRENPHLELNQRFADVADEAEKLRQWFGDLCEKNLYQDKPEDYLKELGGLASERAWQPPPLSFAWPLRSVRALFPRTAWTCSEVAIDPRGLRLTRGGLVVSTGSELLCLAPQSGEATWRQPLIAGGGADAAVQAGDSWVVHQREGFALVDGVTGDLRARWSEEGEVRLRSLMAAAYYPREDELIVVGSEGDVLALVLDGKGGVRRKWSRHVPGAERLHSAIVQGPLVCLQSVDGVITALHPRTGEVAWRVRTGGVPEAPLTYHQGRIYAIHHDPLRHAAAVTALYPFTGRTVWQVRLTGFTTGVPSFVDRWLALAVERHGQVSLMGIDLEAVDPRVVWDVPLASAGVAGPTAILPEVVDGVLHGVVRTDRCEVTCFRMEDGGVRWRSMPTDETFRLFGDLPLARVQDVILNLSNTLDLDLRDLRTGELLHSIELAEIPEFGVFGAPCRVFLGEESPEGDEVDRITAVELSHFIALVE